MTIQIDGLGPLADAAVALGIMQGGNFHPEWFSHPDTYVSQMLRTTVQRDAFVRTLDALFMRDDDPSTDAKGRRWVGVARAEGVSFYVVIGARSDGGSDIAVGARLATHAPGPESTVSVYVPLITVPASGDARVALGARDGRVEIEAHVAFAHAADAVLEGLGVRVDVPTHFPLESGEAAPAIIVALDGLRLPGQATARNVVLGESGFAALGDDVIRLATGLLQNAARTASAEIGEILALIGLSADAALPPLPLEQLFTDGPGAIEGWVSSILASSTALSAWLGHVALLVGRGAVVTPAPRATEPHLVAWTLGSGAQASLTVRAGSAVAGATLFEVGGFLRWESAGGPPGGGVELEVIALRATLGATPTLLGLPRVAVHARVGPSAGAGRLLPPTPASPPLPSISARAFRIGLGLDEARHVGFVLALDDVTIGTRDYPTLDLTNPSTLADVASNAIDGVLDSALSTLGAAGMMIRALLGLAMPPSTMSWPPIAPVHVLDLLSRPLESVLDYHARVLATFPSGYADILATIGSLFLTTPRGALGTGTADRPWRIDLAVLAGGSPRFGILAWQDAGKIRFAIAADATVVDLGGSCPRITARLQADLVAVDFAHRSAEPLPWVGARLEFTGRAAGPLRIGPADAALLLDKIGIELALTSGRFGARLLTPGLGLDVGGEVAPLTLPTVDDAGGFVGTVPFRAIELLCGGILRFIGSAWALELAGAFGWVPGRASQLSIEKLVAGPLREIEEWLAELPTPTKARWLSYVIGGAAAPGLGTGLLSGRGDERSPYLVPLAGGTSWPTSRHGYVFLQTQRGPEKSREDFRPEMLLALLASAPDRTNHEVGSQIARAMGVAAASHEELDDLLDGRGDLAGGFAALLARWTDTDGATSATSATFAGATAHRWEDTPAKELWRHWRNGNAVGLSVDASTIFVTLDAAVWTDIAVDRRIDLTAPSRTPESFDMSFVASLDGPWAATLPRRAAAIASAGEEPTERQAARLARVVDSVFARTARPITLVAEGAAGHAARHVAATNPHVGRLVTLGTPHGGVDYSVLDEGPAASALRLLSIMLPPVDPAAVEIAEVTLGRGLVAALDYVYDARVGDADDRVPPPAPLPVPGAVECICVAGASTGGRVRQALVGLAIRGLQDAFERAAADDPSAIGEEELSTGLGVRAEAGAAIVVTTDARLRLWAVGDAALSPVVVLRADIRRPGGWLAGGPSPGRTAGTSRLPAVRRATMEVVLPLRALAEARVEIVLHEAQALTQRRARWKVRRSGTDGGLDAETRILLGRAFAALGPLPATGPVRSLVDALAAAGLVPAGPTTGGAVALNVEAIERLLLDPAAFLAVARRDRGVSGVATALATFAGGAATGGVVTLSIDGVTVTIDLAATSIGIVATDLRLPGGLDVVHGELHLAPGHDATGRLGLALGGAGPGGRPVIEIASDPLTVRIAWDGLARDPIPLYPAASAAGMARLIRDVVPEQLLWAGITFVRAIDPAVPAVLDPLLRIFGLLTPLPGGGDRVVLPTGLLSAPAEWFLHGATLGSTDGRVDPARLRDLFDATSALLSLRPAGTPSGVWALPFGVTVSAHGDATTRTSIEVAIDPASSLPLTVGAGVAVILPDAARPLGARVEIHLGAGSGATATTLVASAGTDGASIVLDLGGGRHISLYPSGPGITDLGTAASAALIYALPIALDSLAGLASPPAAATFAGALAALGDALGLRVGGHFNADQISQLGAHPGAELPRRIVANLGPGLAALAGLLAPAMPTGWSATASSSALAVHRAGVFDVSFTPTPGAMRLEVTAQPITVFGSARVDGTLVIRESGLGRLRVGFAVDAASPLVAGPLHIAPVAEVDFGSEATSPAVSFGFALPATKRLVGVLRFTPAVSFAIEGRGATLEEAAALLLVPLVADLALSVTDVQTLLARQVFPTATIAQLLDGVILTAGAFDAAVIIPDNLWPRALRLAANVARAAGSVLVAPLTVGVATRTDGAATMYGLSVSIADGQRLVLVDSDTWVGLEVDATWIASSGVPGLSLYLLRLEGTSASAVFDLAVRGLGVRIGKHAGPLLDAGITIDSLALHGLVEFDTTGLTHGGGQLELAGFQLPVGSATGGGNGVASGVLSDARNGNERPHPRFSPAFAVQSSPTGPKFDLRAGPGNGPWWMAIQRGFGPVYIEQIGFGVRKAGDAIDQIQILLDAHASLLGLTVQVQDLALGISTTQPLDNPSSWSVSLAGLSVDVQTSGVTIAGGLRKRDPEVDYIGMLSVKFGVYGITAYGGYAVHEEAGDKYTAFFLFGALLAPIGGPPAFFITGIGAGIGINRTLELPTDFAHFGTYPLIQALDPTAPISQSSADGALTILAETFKPQRGTFWIAAGVSFTSFVLIQGVAVLAVEIGDGLQIALLALARCALPRPEAVLVQLEIALLARFSSKEGVIWVQGQLTDNSWLLTPNCRLTGGFAFVVWYKGPHKGEFVITIGGYHPSFRRDGYPVVPRLGLTWNVSDILVIKGESYFALTSEALMVGMRIEARLSAGPLWAYLRVGGDGIVYFDPFWFSVSVFAEIGAGITIDIDLGWFGHIRITISLSLSASVLLEGPDFRGKASIDLGVCSAEVAFGNWSGNEPPKLPWPAFRRKYIEQGDDPRVLTLSVGNGAQPANPAQQDKPPVGTAGDPFLVIPEFRLELRSKGAVSDLVYANDDGSQHVEHVTALAIAPMRAAATAVHSQLTVAVVYVGSGDDWIAKLGPSEKVTRDSFPKGVWVAVDDRGPIPQGEIIEAGNGATLVSAPTFGDETPEIDYHQVNVGPRLPLPFVSEEGDRSLVADFGADAFTFAEAQPSGAAAAMTVAAGWLASGGTSPARIALERRLAPPRLAPLAIGMGTAPTTWNAAPAPAAKAPARALPPAGVPSLEARLGFATDRLAERARTSVGEAAKSKAKVVAAPSLASVRERVAVLGAARLMTMSPSAIAGATGVLHGTVIPFSGRAGAGLELRSASGQGGARVSSADAADLAGPQLANGAPRGETADGDVPAGELRVYRMPNAARERDLHRPRIDVQGASRLVVLAPMGNVLSDAIATQHGIDVPIGAERLVVVPGPDPRAEVAGFMTSTRLAQIGQKTLLGPGCVVDSSTLRVRRFAVTEVRASWVRASEATAGASEIVVRFMNAPRAIAVVLEQADGGANVEDIELVLSGATLVPSPRALITGGTVVLLYDVQPAEGDALKAKSGSDAVRVTLTKSERVHLGGILGFARGANEFATLLRDHDVHALLGPLARPDQPARVRFQPNEPNGGAERRA